MFALAFAVGCSSGFTQWSSEPGAEEPDPFFGDDDDSTTDDDDATPAPGAPVITSVSASWNASTAEFEFTIYMSDGDCDLGLPTMYWSLGGVEQLPSQLTGTPITCTGIVYLYVGSLTPGGTYEFAFWIDDDAGNLSDPYPITATAN